MVATDSNCSHQWLLLTANFLCPKEYTYLLLLLKKIKKEILEYTSELPELMPLKKMKNMR